MKVDVYKNLTKDCFSIRSREYFTRGKVIKHVDSAFIVDVEFAVQRAGRSKVLKEKKKNVHAFVRGTYVDLKEYVLEEILRDCFFHEVTYNPYVSGSFFLKSDQSLVDCAELVIIKDKKVYARNIS